MPEPVLKITLPSCLLLCAALLYPGQLQTVAAQQASSDIWDGIYTDSQITRGQRIYQAECASCHKEDLTGQDMSPSLVGVGFSFSWQGRSVQELYASMRRGMPQTAPGSLSDRDYADLTAFLLARNGFPAGVNQDKQQALGQGWSRGDREWGHFKNSKLST